MNEPTHTTENATPDMTTIGGLIAALSDLNPTAEVYVGNMKPAALSSYRGYYSDLAIERGISQHEKTGLDQRPEPFTSDYVGYYAAGHGEVHIKRDATVADLIEALELSIGAEFEGYKGGQFTMWASTDLWVSEYGNCDSLRVVGIEDLGDRVDLVVKEVQGW